MEIEYEDQPQTIAPSGLLPRPPVEMPEEDESEQEPEEEDEEEEDVEGGEDAVPVEKKKRVIKQRQSLAEKQQGTTIFPISRVKKIIKADKELDMMTGEACFMIAVATEYFIKHFMEEGYTKARLDKRKMVNYRDMAAVVERSEEFDFLRDVIPMPMPLSEALLRRQQQRHDADPTIQEDGPEEDVPLSDDLPPLAPSTNPLFPNAFVKRPPNGHGRVPKHPKPPPAAVDTTNQDVAEPEIPKVLSAKTGPSTPHGLQTRRSARKSLMAEDAEAMVVDHESTTGESAEQSHEAHAGPTGGMEQD
ncbi:histone-fold-containing protein [Kockovaella imperatae]|uniref:Histone-fold-containing protein n=1 Tax=Kockovaella imperatae TaxID=4999 RepID=A0A1Y1UQL8_9TREE|nr:histone-fold-containing protein [Kockovaella imperatae]ORX39435.1 histone-fold-containing protein [Kockovaella imperatae]